MSNLPLPDDKSKASDESKIADDSKASDETKAIEELKAAPEKLKHGPAIEHSSRVHHKKHKKHAKHGAWKLVYADFVTVMMAFFIVVWVALFENVSKRDELDTSCIEPLATELKAMIQGDSGLQGGKMPFDIEYSKEGLQITLKDAGEPLFQRGGTTLSDFAKKQFQKISTVVMKCPTHKLKIEGYTDAEPYGGGGFGYSNWELSSERANSARRELILEKVPIERIAQVIGYGESVPSMPNDPKNPLNRRISITVIPPKMGGSVAMGGMAPQ